MRLASNAAISANEGADVKPWHAEELEVRVDSIFSARRLSRPAKSNFTQPLENRSARLPRSRYVLTKAWADRDRQTSAGRLREFVCFVGHSDCPVPTSRCCPFET